MSNCDILNNKIKKCIEATDYLINPEVPTWKPARPGRYNYNRGQLQLTN